MSADLDIDGGLEMIRGLGLGIRPFIERLLHRYLEEYTPEQRSAMWPAAKLLESKHIHKLLHQSSEPQRANNGLSGLCT